MHKKCDICELCTELFVTWMVLEDVKYTVHKQIYTRCEVCNTLYDVK